MTLDDKNKRFSFGANFINFLNLLNKYRIQKAENSLYEMLGIESLKGEDFLDIGSGSDLISLAARRLGAKAYFFDFDPQSVECTVELRRRYFLDDFE